MRRLTVFAHYDAGGEVRPYVLKHLAALRAQLGGRTEFVSNSPMSQTARSAVGPLVDGVRLRENVGFDFGMWADAIRDTDLDAVDELVLTNSSVVGPLTLLGPIFERMDAGGWEFWGMTETHQLERHLQTYFLVFKPRVLRSPAFRRFFESVLPYRKKNSTILAYELGLTPFLWQEGFRGAPAFPTPSLPARLLADLLVRRRITSPRRELRRNPTLFYPDRLLAGGMPYVKTELLRDQPWRARALGIERAVGAFLATTAGAPDWPTSPVPGTAGRTASARVSPVSAPRASGPPPP